MTYNVTMSPHSSISVRPGLEIKSLLSQGDTYFSHNFCFALLKCALTKALIRSTARALAANIQAMSDANG